MLSLRRRTVATDDDCKLIKSKIMFIWQTFYPRDAMLARVIEIATCLSVRPSVRHAPVLCQNEES